MVQGDGKEKEGQSGVNILGDFLKTRKDVLEDNENNDRQKREQLPAQL